MKSFMKTYFIIFGILSALCVGAGLLFWGLSKIFGEDGLIIGVVTCGVMIISLLLTLSIKTNT